MKIFEIIKFALEKGCNKSVEEVFTSGNWKSRQEYLKNLSDDEKTAVQIGPLLLGKLLREQKLRKEEWGKVVHEGSENYFNDEIQELSLMIDVVGEELIKTGESTLPQEALDLVEKWKSNKKEEQIEVVRSLFYIFRSKEQQPIPTTKEGLKELLEFELKLNIQGDLGRFLPAQFKNSPLDPNCLGREIQLAAFAKLCGAEAYSALVVKSITEIDCSTTLSVIRMIEKDLSERKIKNDEAFEESLEIQKRVAEIKLEEEVARFHNCILLKLVDGNWILADPYGVSWGSLPSDMQHQMEKADRILKKYRNILPGLSILLMSDDFEQQLKIKFEEFQNWLKKSRETENHLRDAKNSSDLVEKLLQSGGFDEVIQSPTLKEAKEIVEKIPRMKKRVARILFEPMVMNVGLERTVEEIVTLYHLTGCSKLLDWFDKAKEDGKIIHSALEIMNPSFSVGLGVINDLAILQFNTFQFVEELASTCYAQHALCNVLHGALLEPNEKRWKFPFVPSEFVGKCLKLLQEEKVQHSIVRKTLKSFLSLLPLP